MPDRVSEERTTRVAGAGPESRETLLATLLAHARTDRDPATLLHAIARAAREGTGAEAAALFVVDSRSRKPALAASSGLDALAARADHVRALARAAERTMRRRSAMRAGDVERAAEAEPVGESWTGVPLLVPGSCPGALVCLGTGDAAGEDAPRFLHILADVAAMALDRQQWLTAARSSEQKLLETRAKLVSAERMAALGEIGTRMAKELRAPVASIAGFGRKLERSLAGNAPAREYLDVILDSAERLERVCSEQLEFADLTRPRLRVEDLNRVAEEVIGIFADEIRRKNARFIRRLGPDLPGLLLDAERIRQVLRNILSNVLAELPEDGRLKVETKRIGEYAQVIVAGDGTRMAGELLDRLFVPFAATRTGGAGLGLAVANQIVREHGGEIGVRSDADWATHFTMTFPIKRNADRRRKLGDRRGRFRDRRTEPGEAA